MKYFIYGGDATLGIKYNIKTNVMSIGCYEKFKLVLIDIVKYIVMEEIGLDDIKYPQKNKIRLDVEMDFDRYYKIIERLKDSDYVIEQTNTLFRIMR